MESPTVISQADIAETWDGKASSEFVVGSLWSIFEHLCPNGGEKAGVHVWPWPSWLAIVAVPTVLINDQTGPISWVPNSNCFPRCQ